jgi:hypothetical protein
MILAKKNLSPTILAISIYNWGQLEHGILSGQDTLWRLTSSHASASSLQSPTHTLHMPTPSVSWASTCSGIGKDTSDNGNNKEWGSGWGERRRREEALCLIHDTLQVPAIKSDTCGTSHDTLGTRLGTYVYWVWYLGFRSIPHVSGMIHRTTYLDILRRGAWWLTITPMPLKALDLEASVITPFHHHRQRV